MSDTIAPVDDPKDFGRGRAGVAERWQAEMRAYDRAWREWRLDCRDIQRRYRDDDPVRADDPAVIGQARFNVLWSNVQTLTPALYSRPPVPVVMRRYRDRDPVARVAATILQRALSFTIEAAQMDERVRHCVLDYALFARGTAWMRYCPAEMIGTDETTQVIDSDDESVGATLNQVAQIVAPDLIKPEAVEWDYVYRDDFYHGPGKTWADVDWVGRIVRMTRAQGIKRFGARFRNVDLTWTPVGAYQTDRTNDYDRDDEVIRRAEVVEIWCKSERKVIFIGNPLVDPMVLEEEDDPLGLEHFFPCPQPLFGTMTAGTMIPVPDYKEYRDQARELDDLTGRIAALTSAIRMNFAYNNEFPELARIFDEGMENQGIAIEDWSKFATTSGMQGALSFVPLQDMIGTLQSLIEARATVKADLYEITGISDIIRGSSAPEETATAQRIKGRYAGLRLSDRQFAVSRFVRDMLRLTAEVIAEKYSPATLWEVSNFSAMDHGEQDPAVLFVKAVDLLRNEKTRGFQIDIEDQSTIALDDGEDKRDRMEFLGSVGQLIQSAIALPPAMGPAMLPMLGKMIMFAARGFRIGAEMEVTIEDAISQLGQDMKQKAQQPPQPDPEAIKAQAQQARMHAELQIKQVEAQAGLHIESMKAQSAQAIASVNLQIAQTNLAIKQIEAQQAGLSLQATTAQQAAQNQQDMTDHLIKVGDAELRAEESAHQQAIDWAKLDLEAQKIDAAHEAREGSEEMENRGA